MFEAMEDRGTREKVINGRESGMVGIFGNRVLNKHKRQGFAGPRSLQK